MTKTYIPVCLFCFTLFFFRDTKEKLNARHLSPATTSPQSHKQTVQSSRDTPEPKDKDRARERVQSQETPTQSGETEDQRHKDSQQEKKEKTTKCDQRPAEEKAAPEDTLSPQQQKIRVERRSSDGSQWEPDAKRSRLEAEHAKSVHVKVKEERKEIQDSPEIKPPSKVMEKPVQDRRTPGMQPLPMSSMPVPLGMAGFPHGLERTRLTPLVGMSPLSGAERFSYPPQHWDPIRSMSRGLDICQKDPVAKELLLRGDPLQRVYPREPLLHPLMLEQQQRCQLEERHRLALLREESERSRLLALHHHAALETQLAHPGLLPAPYASPLFPRLALPHAAPYGTLSKALHPTGYIHAPPLPLLHGMPMRPPSPRRTTPLADRNIEAP